MISAGDSFSGEDVYLSYLPEFRVKSESASRPLPCYLSVLSLRDFVGDLPDELLLCPVRALRHYLSRTASVPSRPRSLFVSPRTPSCCLSKNALSLFIRDVIAEAYSASGSPLPSVPCSSHSSGSSRSSSFLRAHGVRGVAASLAFLRNAPSLSVLEAATRSSSSVFTAFYLKGVQFSSSSGYSLGPVVAAGYVV